MSFLYFAYGSNMLSSRLTARCPSAKVIGLGTAKYWNLEFSKKSIDGSGKATLISTTETSRTTGVLFEIGASDLNELDRFEGAGYERSDKFSIETDDGPLSATTYLASERHSDMVPYDWYLALIVAGALEHKLNDAHTARLRMATRKPDQNLTRKSRNAALKALALHDHVDYLKLLEN
ncbi:gamma-glutamylcyclotransferase family protein [Roseovarius sp. 2305UL8-3]|uniref:gamma-glutamylcyclotransferase family protein n=1 Tax=Roseovarius conchicola TaxID=3121636 RepID=UPI003528CE65